MSNEILDYIYDTISNRTFELAIVISIAIIIIFSIYRKLSGKKGSWADKIFYNEKKQEKKKVPVDSKGETECRRVLEKLFEKPFPKIRPDMLRNPITEGENNLELDCYNPELKLAVEYNGIQHYKYVPYFHKTKESFYNQKYRDYVKRDLCKKNGIVLIEVPYTVKVQDIEEYLKKELKKYIK